MIEVGSHLRAREAALFERKRRRKKIELKSFVFYGDYLQWKKTSTHRSRWIFTPQDLVEKHEIANQRAAKMLEQSTLKPLNCEEEQLMRVFYEQKIQEVCGAFMFPHKIQATAIIYFKRFYLQWSVMEHHPKHIMLTCIYASCKVEENHVSAEELGKGIQQDHKMILNNEMLVLQSLGFDLIVYAPYRSLEGFVDDIEEFCHSRIDEPSKLKDLLETAKSEIDKIMLTDAPLLFPPGQLALAALCRSNEVHRVLSFESYLESIFNRQYTANSPLELSESLKAVDFLVEKLKIPTAKDMRHIDRKLKNCWDPSPVDDSKKREKRSKHKSKRTGSETQGVPLEM
ncbi:hypothetical protein J5N97_000563 [Dioscorea zingiberensis]|uniref:Cyclin-H1-1 n=1 Tax=Dioscorea zingiberensis TaxID=325984 RepID=A0A9D5BVD3_9LILI|nr:hypothetical protein J5N97_000563 [Dioscorea zingiberensis]